MSVKPLQWFRNVLVSADQFLNTIALGDPDETISSRLGKAAMRGSKTAHVLCHVIGWVLGPGHCNHAIEGDEGKDAADAT